MTEPQTPREQLARDLKFLRESARLTERQLADRLGTTQSVIHRQENAGPTATSRSLKPQLIEAWAEATGASKTMQARLRMLIEASFRNDQTWRERLSGRFHLQDEMRANEAAAHTIRNFQPTIVPGLLQTPEYASFVIRLADVEQAMDHAEALTSRLQRQEALFNGQQRFEFLIGESALRWPSSHPEMLAAQLDRIATLSSLKSVSVAVLPLGEPVNVVAWSNFVILEGDASFVSIELTHREDPLADDRRVDLYRTLYARMWERALTDQDAVLLLRRIAAELRG